MKKFRQILNEETINKKLEAKDRVLNKIKELKSENVEDKKLFVLLKTFEQ